MAPHVLEWLNLALRWAHVVAGIMWIGDSFLFMWLDSHLSKPSRPRDGEVVGELWMTHSGGFYEVVKRKSLRPEELPQQLFWFKWESYSTWITGFFLLGIVFHAQKGALLIDPAVHPWKPGAAAAVSVALLPAAYGLYELLWRTPLARLPRLFAAVGVGLAAALAWGLGHWFSARASFLLVGACLGTVMSANVFFRIIPAQKHMLAMTRAGQPVDTSYGLRAKGRSIQNHYLTFPVLFCMLSAHFPSTYGSPLPWLTLALVFVAGMGAKLVMNRRSQTPPLLLVGTLLAFGAAAYQARPRSELELQAARFEGRPPVPYATVATILQTRCVTCHAAHPTSPMFTAPPLGITLESPEDVRRHAPRIFMRSAATRTMPLANLTAMTDEERALIGAWFAQGAQVDSNAPATGAPP